jgi:hypothetical protein
MMSSNMPDRLRMCAKVDVTTSRADMLREAAGEIDALSAELKRANAVNRWLRINAGNAESGLKQYREAWRWSHTREAVTVRERDNAIAELAAARAEAAKVQAKFLRAMGVVGEELGKRQRAEMERDEARAEVGRLTMDLKEMDERRQALVLDNAIWQKENRELLASLKAARPRPRPDREALGKIAHRADAAPLPTGTGRPPVAGWYWFDAPRSKAPQFVGQVEFDHWHQIGVFYGRWAGPLTAAPWEEES